VLVRGAGEAVDYATVCDQNIPLAVFSCSPRLQSACLLREASLQPETPPLPPPLIHPQGRVGRHWNWSLCMTFK
jgi:hypothetical protein